ncbi:hypothetical protein BSL82_10495 [Tardibacter chloracetimidivorans]|uniref:HTH tetR-type domain-containing protein n=1 Tax=Tardibacter chloracetimidivorans TaxID=1921510 RepID=A0A1L3ZVR0_9SPHN|nr:hypothetical protein BSL82_10495 [Tardibacter chloracetimidivorans]
MTKTSIDARKPLSGPAARRERIIVAALDLIRQPGGGSVQMREVAEHADVALGTLYRNFPSRMELMAYAYERWREGCFEKLLSSDAVQGATYVERFTNVTRLDYSFLEQEPSFCEISVMLSRSSDLNVAACIRRIREKSYEIYLRALEGVDRADALSVIDIFAAVMEGQASLFATGRVTGEAAHAAMERCIYMLLVWNIDSMER